MTNKNQCIAHILLNHFFTFTIFSLKTCSLRDRDESWNLIRDQDRDRDSQNGSRDSSRDRDEVSETRKNGSRKSWLVLRQRPSRETPSLIWILIFLLVASFIVI